MTFTVGNKVCVMRWFLKKETISHIFLNLVDNIQDYNARGI